METTQALNPGDTVRIKDYLVTNLYGQDYPGRYCGKQGVVIKLYEQGRWPLFADVTLRVMADDLSSAVEALVPSQHLELVERGPGFFKLGQTHPFSEQELSEQRWERYVQACQAAELTHEGFANPATFLAWMYLNQEPSAHHRLCQFVRKDGRINPNKVQKLFSDSKLDVDAWAYEFPVPVPAEFAAKRWGHPIAERLQVNWQEVADTIARSLGEQRLAV